MDNIETIKNVDPHKRKPIEWAKIYNLKLMSSFSENLWSEYEWAYYFSKLKYMPMHDIGRNGQELDTFDKSTEMEMRAFELNRDLFVNADLGEKMILKEKYIETGWVRKMLMLV